MSRELTPSLATWLDAGRSQIGQILIRPALPGFELRHFADNGLEHLAAYEGADFARQLANLDDAGQYRPLKTAPNLRRGWRLTVPDLAELRRALDFFYPAMLGLMRSYQNGQLVPVGLRETLGRQTGMYRITQMITDEQARTMTDHFCAGCMKCRLWDGQTPTADRHMIPLLCQEACNLLVAEARRVVKSQPSA